MFESITKQARRPPSLWRNSVAVLLFVAILYVVSQRYQLVPLFEDPFGGACLHWHLLSYVLITVVRINNVCSFGLLNAIRSGQKSNRFSILCDRHWILHGRCLDAFNNFSKKIGVPKILIYSGIYYVLSYVFVFMYHSRDYIFCFSSDFVHKL